VTGNELKVIRTGLGLTQEELGQRLGVRKNTIWRWENEQRRIPEPVARLVQHVAKEVRAEQKRRKRT
jgi:transcriptional regulator with XRE-family HTH domain